MTALAIVVLAAGMGTRMKSAMPKVLHKIAGRSLLSHALHAAQPLNPQRVVIVQGPEMPAVATEASRVFPQSVFVEQRERRGTGHAVLVAKTALQDFAGTTLVIYGDVPLVQPETLTALLATVDAKHKMAVLGFEAENPTGYGRLIGTAKAVTDIREELDATPKEKKISRCNSGIIAIDNALLWKLIPKLSNTNAKHEYYLTDLVALAVKAKTKVALSLCDESEVSGVNDRSQLAALEARFQQTARRKAMLGGATLIDPGSVSFSADTILGQDVVIEPHVVFGSQVTIGNTVEILAFSHIEGATIADGARIGPFARLRPGAEIGDNAHIGNFVEVKNARIGKGAKANHLSYIGDADVGAGSNIGAGTITCNYDGYEKHRTIIGENVFVGSNTSLVAPVKIGSDANIAAGSVITADVPGDALALTRPPMVVKEGWAKRYRAVKSAAKAARKKA